MQSTPPLRFVLFLLVGLVAAVAPPAQKRALTHGDYDSWRRLRGVTFSPDGKWAACPIRPATGDGVLEVHSTVGNRVYKQERGSSPTFTWDSRFLVFRIDPSAAEMEKYRNRSRTTGRSGRSTPGGRSGRFPNLTPAQRERIQAMMQGRRMGGRRGMRGMRSMPTGLGAAPGRSGRTASEPPRATLVVFDLARGVVVKRIPRIRTWSVPRRGPSYLFYRVYEKKAPTARRRPGSAPGGRRGPARRPGTGTSKKVTKPGAQSKAKPQTVKKEAGRTTSPVKKKATKAPPRAVAEKKAAPVSKKATPVPVKGTPPKAKKKVRAKTPPRKQTGRKQPPKGKTPPKTTKPVRSSLPSGYTLIRLDLATGREITLKGVVSHGFTNKRALFWLVAAAAKKGDVGLPPGLHLVDLGTGKSRRLAAGAANYGRLVFARDERSLVFTSDLADRKAKAKKPVASIYHWREGMAAARRILGADHPGLPEDHPWGSGPSLSLSRDGSALQFSLRRKRVKAPKPLPADKQVKLDIWHWKDGLLQTQQARFGRFRSGDDRVTCIYHLGPGRLVLLKDTIAARARMIDPAGTLALASDGEPYYPLTTWDGRYYDHWLVDLVDGTRHLAARKVRGSAMNSPGGRYIVYFGGDRHWHLVDTRTRKDVAVTALIPVPFDSETWDKPEPAKAYGIAGWTENDREVLLYDRYDIWLVSGDGKRFRCITEGWGRRNRVVLRINRLNRGEDRSHLRHDESLLLSAVSTDTYASGFFKDAIAGSREPEKLLWWNKATGAATTTPRGNTLFIRPQTFHEYPDLWACSPDFGRAMRLTRVNPQQKGFLWGRSELVNWRSGDGIPLKGILYKPEGFDPKRKYPMMIYFYEQRSSRVHSYVTPSAGTSPNISFYVSRGYLFFVPDIVYKTGYPGMSCLKCLVPGVLHLIDRGYVDRDNIGIAGHSWGGYQTAYLVTQTDLFKCAESGAPVSNMFSAYGGIRWGSGMSRQWQYEKSQSRIGGTPWEYPLRYLENSPLFFADKVNTPVLMIHNDKDGAVPWYQGIEFFMALRRLNKEAYLFNYNGADHGLRRDANKRDWTRRMQEFFDHHLKGVPAPKWMREGVPYAERDREKIDRARAARVKL